MRFKRLKEKPPFKNLVMGSINGLELSNTQVLLTQFSKLLNYFPNDLDVSWGGGDAPLTLSQLNRARFSFEATVAVGAVDKFWLEKLRQEEPWGPKNFVLTDSPKPELGAPYEPYLGCNGVLLTLSQASKVLAVDKPTLCKLKLRHLLDELVIRECLKQFLLPPPLWKSRRMFREGVHNTNPNSIAALKERYYYV